MLNLTGKIIRIVAVESEAIIELPDGSTENGEITGIGINLLESMQMILNFSFTPLIFVKEFSSKSEFSSHFNASIVQGMSSKTPFILAENESVASVFQSNSADVALGFLYFLASRFRVAHALLPLSDEKFKLYFQQPKITQFDNPFYRQFSTGLAATYIAVMFVSGFFMTFYITLTTKTGEPFSSQFRHFWQIFHESVLWMISTWCRQDFGLYTPDWWQYKFIMNLLSQLSYLLHSIYCAVILVSLTQNLKPVRRIENLFQYKYTFFAYADTKDRLLAGREQIFAWNPPAPSSEVDDIYEYEKTSSIARLINHRHAHLDTADNFYPDLDKVLSSTFSGSNSSASKKLCENLSSFRMIGGGMVSGLYVRKEFGYRSEFNFALLKIRQTGVNRRLIRAYENVRLQKTGCRDAIKRGGYQENLGMTYLGSMFTCLGAAYALTLFLITFELCCVRRRNFLLKCLSLVR